MTGAVDLLGCSSVGYSLTIGGSPSNPSYAGETSYSVAIANIFEATHTIVLKVDINIAYSALLYDSNMYPPGTEVTYKPHNGASGGIISENIREAVVAHEKGHANYVINVIRPELEDRMTRLESKWIVHSWTEAEVRHEIALAIAELEFSYYSEFHNAANQPTIDWFNSSPDWRLIHDDSVNGKWKWVKE